MKHNMTEGNEIKHITLFALPLMLSILLQMLYNVVDGAIVGNFVSSTALAAVGTCTALCNVFLAIASGLSTGASVVISQYFGARKNDEVRRTVSTAYVFLLTLGIIAAIIGCILTRPILKYILAVPDNVMEEAVTYMFIYSIGLVFQFAYNTFAGVLRALGNSRATLYFLIVSTIVNAALAMLFVVKFQMGIAGAALATVIAQAVSALTAYAYLYKTVPELRLKKRELICEKEKVYKIIKIGLPITMMQGLVAVSQVIIQRFTNSFGVDTIEAYTSAARIEGFAVVPISGFNSAMATFTGQNMGAGKIERVKKGYREALLVTSVVCVALCFVIYFFGPAALNIFNVSDTALLQGTQYLHTMAFFLIFFNIQFCTSGVLQGAGDSLFPMIASISGLCVRLIAAYIMCFHTVLTYQGLWKSMPMHFAVAMIVVVVRYLSGGWKNKTVVGNEKKISAG